MSIGTILLIILVIILRGGFSGLRGGRFYGTIYEWLESSGRGPRV
jgi:hypothetical protein